MALSEITKGVKTFFAEKTTRIQTNWNNMSTAHKVVAIGMATLMTGVCIATGVLHGAIAASFLAATGSIAFYAVVGANTLAAFSALLSDLLKKSHEKAQTLSQKAAVVVEMVVPPKKPAKA